ncbi:MAG: LamG-like jellyroll fold domain-containing protein [Pseudomonadota bacterium]
MTASKLLRNGAFALIGAGNILAIATLWQNYDSAVLKGWDCSYPLLVGNEASGDRPWLGRIHGIALYPAGLGAEAIRALAASPMSKDGIALRQEHGAGLFLSFDDGADATSPLLLPAAATPGPSLAGNGAGWDVSGGALNLTSPTVLEIDEAFLPVCEAMMSAAAFTAEVKIARPGPPQGGPARIISSSASPLLRNFTLGEEFGALVLRTRTPWTGQNGERLALTSGSDVVSDDWRHVVVGFEAGSAFMYVDGAPAVPATEYSRFYRVNDDPHHTVVAPIAFLAIPLFALIGLVSGLLGQRETLGSLVLYAGAGIGLSLATAILLPLVFGSAVNLGLVAAIVLSGVLGAALSRLLPSGWRI